MEIIMAELERVAREEFDGHVTVLRFTTNWRVGFGTLSEAARVEIDMMPAGATFEEAARKALETRFCIEDVTPEMVQDWWARLEEAPL